MGKKELILEDYRTVVELIKFATNQKKKIKVDRMGNDYVGVYWKVSLN